MLDIQKTVKTVAAFSLAGRLDTITAPQLENALRDVYDKVDELVLDLEGLNYISSAGLRVLLSARKAMAQKGEVKLRHVNESILELIKVTGFSEFLTIE